MFGLKKAEFNFDDNRLISIVGENGSGKSSIMDSVVFALLGKATASRGVKIEDYLRRGASIGSVELIFTDKNGVKHKIVRTLTLSAKRISHQAKLFTYNDARGWQNDSDMLNDIQQKIASILLKGKIETGSQEELKALVKQAEAALLISAFISQGNVSKILSVTPAERMSLISAAFNICGSDRLKSESKELKKIADGEYKQALGVRTALQERMERFGQTRDVIQNTISEAQNNIVKYHDFKNKYYEIYTNLTSLIKTSEDYAQAASLASEAWKVYSEALNYESAKVSLAADKDFKSIAAKLKDTVNLLRRYDARIKEISDRSKDLDTQLRIAENDVNQAKSEYCNAEKLSVAAQSYRKKKELEEAFENVNKEQKEAEMQLHKYREQLQSAKQLIETDTHKEAIKDFRDATSKLHQLSAAEAAKTAVEKRYREADKLLPLCNILREKDILQNNIDTLISQKESVSNDITASGEKLKTSQKEILEYTIKSIWKEYIDLTDLKNLTESNLTNIEDKLVKTLIALLYEFSDAGIINLNEITLASDKIMKWADAFEHSEFKALVQQSGSLRAKLSDAEKRINEMLMQYPYLNEDRPSIDATINELKASIHDLTLESARLETEKASLEQTYRKINEDIDVAESKLKILTEQSCNVDEEAVWRAEREISALKEEYDNACRHLIKVQTEAENAPNKCQALLLKYPGLDKEADDDARSLSEIGAAIQERKIDITKHETSIAAVLKLLKQTELRTQQIQEKLNDVNKKLNHDIPEQDAYDAESRRTDLLEAYNKANKVYFEVKNNVVKHEAELSKLAGDRARIEEELVELRQKIHDASTKRLTTFNSYANNNKISLQEAIFKIKDVKIPAGYISLESAHEAYTKACGVRESLNKNKVSIETNVQVMVQEYNSIFPVKIDNQDLKTSSSTAFNLSRKYDGMSREAERTAAAYAERLQQYDSTLDDYNKNEKRIKEIEPLKKYAQTLSQMADGSNFTRFMSDTAMSMLLSGVNSYLESIGENWKVASKDGELYVQGAEGAPRPVSGMSGGEQVLISVLLLKHISNFGCLWLDESLPNLDERRLKETVDILTADNNSQLLLTTHDPDLARLFPLTWTMEDGRLVSTQKQITDSLTFEL